MSAQENNTSERVRSWWAAFPMTYGTSEHGSTTFRREDGSEESLALGTKEFFDAVDQTFYEWNEPLHTAEVPFARLFPYESFRGRRVLEVGCGMGTMAMGWARQGARITAVDMNPVAVQQTTQRFRLFDVPGTVLQSDARSLPFAADSFDYFYSWGVLHHSPDLERSVEECFRVLKPGGRYGVMLYDRESILFRYRIQFVEGFLHGESRFLGPVELASRYADGDRQEGNPHTWPVTAKEASRIFGRHSHSVQMRRFGLDLDKSLPQLIPLPGMRRLLPRSLRKPWARRWGWSLWISGVKS
jgi:SAM-dependent methyltransferase